MRPSDQLAEFTRAALAAGQSRPDIRNALHEAGWSESETDGALDAWAEDGFVVPVPRPRAFVSAREAFFYGLMFLALILTTWQLTALSFNLIDRWITGPVDDYSRWDADTARWAIAFLVVFAPLFLYLNHRTAKATRADDALKRSTIRKWFGYVTLFLAACALLGDLIFVIYTFLDGELTGRVLAKTATVLLIAGVVFLYYRSEMKLMEDG